MIDLSGKRFLVAGVANDRSIAWGITEKIRECGGEVVLLSHPSMEERVLSLVQKSGMRAPFFFDAADETSVVNCFAQLQAESLSFDGFVHSIGFALKAELQGPYFKTSRANFQIAMLVSCYSFTEMARYALGLMREGGSMLTLTFEASHGSYPHYNVMGPAKAALEASVLYLATDLGAYGIRVNAISASPLDTLAARGIGHFQRIGEFSVAMSPMGRRATIPEVASEAVYLLSPESSGVTGQNRFVDCGVSAVIMPPSRNAAKMSEAMRKIAEIHTKQQGGTSE